MDKAPNQIIEQKSRIILAVLFHLCDTHNTIRNSVASVAIYISVYKSRRKALAEYTGMFSFFKT